MHLIYFFVLFCFNGWISRLSFLTHRSLSHLELKAHSEEIPGAKWAVPQTSQFTTNLSPPHELVGRDGSVK